MEDDTNNGKRDSQAHADGKSDKHRFLAHRTARNRFYLLVQDVNGGLCQDDGQAQKEGEYRQEYGMRLRKLLSHFKADGHKSDFYGGKENNQAEEGVKYADQDLNGLFLVRAGAHENRLQNEEANDDRPKR